MHVALWMRSWKWKRKQQTETSSRNKFHLNISLNSNYCNFVKNIPMRHNKITKQTKSLICFYDYALYPCVIWRRHNARGHFTDEKKNNIQSTHNNCVKPALTLLHVAIFFFVALNARVHKLLSKSKSSLTVSLTGICLVVMQLLVSRHRKMHTVFLAWSTSTETSTKQLFRAHKSYCTEYAKVLKVFTVCFVCLFFRRFLLFLISFTSNHFIK